MKFRNLDEFKEFLELKGVDYLPQYYLHCYEALTMCHKGNRMAVVYFHDYDTFNVIYNGRECFHTDLEWKGSRLCFTDNYEDNGESFRVDINKFKEKIA